VRGPRARLRIGRNVTALPLSVTPKLSLDKEGDSNCESLVAALPGQDTIVKAMRESDDVAETAIMFDSCETAQTIR
jgi:hypothetical protein